MKQEASTGNVKCGLQAKLLTIALEPLNHMHFLPAMTQVKLDLCTKRAKRV